MTGAEPRGGLPPLCVISDPGSDPDRAVDDLLRLLHAGIGWVQLRVKGQTDRALLAAARRLSAEAPEAGLVTLNDRCDVALAAGIRSVHLGEDDLPAGDARPLLGDAAVIGVSTHAASEAAAADPAASYVAIGPIFESGSKTTARRILGASVFAEVRSRGVTRPLVAIGGIREASLAGVFAAGATSVAVIGAVWGAGDPVGAALRLQASALRARGPA